MQTREKELHLLDYLRIVNTRRHILLSFTALVVGVVTVASFVGAPQYKSTVKLLHNHDNNTTLTFGEAGSPLIQVRDVAEYYNTQKKLLFSRNFVDRVVKQYDLDKHPYFTEMKKKGQKKGVVSAVKGFLRGLTPENERKQEQEKLSLDAQVQRPDKEERDPWVTNLILSQMKVDVGSGSSIMEIHFQGDHPGMVAYLANCIGTAYIEYNLDLRIMPYKNSVEWLAAKLAEIKNKVEVSQKALQQYKENRGIVTHEARESILMQKIQGLSSALVSAQGARLEAEIRYKRILEVLDKPELLTTVQEIMNNPVIQGLRSSEMDLQWKVSELSGKYGPKHPHLIRAQAELDMMRQNIINEARKMLAVSKTAYEIALSREKALAKNVEEDKQEAFGLSRELIAYRVVSEESESNRRFYEMLLKKLQEATFMSGVTVTNIQVIDKAIPSGPIGRNRTKNILLSVVIGLFGGIFLAIFVDYMDDTLKTQDDVETQTDQHYLGMVPAVQDKKAVLNSSYPVHEAYRTIRMGLKFSASGKTLKTILITSAVPSEGKTTTASNLAMVLSQMGERTLLIDADLRRSGIHKYFRMDNAVGVGSVIAEKSDVFSAIRRAEGLPNLSILSAGPHFPNPSEVIASDAMKDLLASLQNTFDRIVIDSPPIMPVFDPLVLSGLVDGVILIVRGGVTSRVMVQKACQSLKTMKASIVGIVLNNVKIHQRGYGYYYYYNYYNYYQSYGETKKETT